MCATQSPVPQPAEHGQAYSMCQNITVPTFSPWAESSPWHWGFPAAAQDFALLTEHGAVLWRGCKCGNLVRLVKANSFKANDCMPSFFFSHSFWLYSQNTNLQAGMGALFLIRYETFIPTWRRAVENGGGCS